MQSTRLYRSLKRRGFPKDRFRLLCANCNLGRYLNGGVCPHHNRPTEDNEMTVKELITELQKLPKELHDRPIKAWKPGQHINLGKPFEYKGEVRMEGNDD